MILLHPPLPECGYMKPLLEQWSGDYYTQLATHKQHLEKTCMQKKVQDPVGENITG